MRIGGVIPRAILFLCSGLAWVEAENRLPEVALGVRLLGLDGSISYVVAEPLKDWPTRLWLSAGAGYEDAHLYRTFEGTDTVGRHTDTPIANDDATYKILDVDVAAGASQDITVGTHVLSAFLLGTFRFERHDPSWASGALIYDSALPDRTQLRENGFCVGILLRKTIPPGLAMRLYPLVYSLEASLRAAPRWLGNDVADYARVSVVGTALLQLVSARLCEVYLATRLGFDTLWGSELPIHARTTVGRIGPPFFTLKPGLGGAVRGLAPGRFDGTTKAYINLDARLRFPLSSLVVPVVTLFVDGGVADYRLLDHRLDASDALYTAGVNLSADVARLAQIGYTISYAFNETDPMRRLGHALTLEAQF